MSKSVVLAILMVLSTQLDLVYSAPTPSHNSMLVGMMRTMTNLQPITDIASDRNGCHRIHQEVLRVPHGVRVSPNKVCRPRLWTQGYLALVSKPQMESMDDFLPLLEHSVTSADLSGSLFPEAK